MSRQVMPRWGAALMVAVTVLLAGCSSGTDAVSNAGFTFVSPGGKSEFTYPAAERKGLGPIAGPDLTGKNRLAVSDYRGKVVVLNFWGSWCAPCRAEAPDLEAVWKSMRDKSVQFLGIDIKDGNGSDGLAFVKSKQITYPSIVDPDLRTMLSIQGYPTNSIPSTIVLDKQGRVAYINLGSITATKLAAVVAPLADEPA